MQFSDIMFKRIHLLAFLFLLLASAPGFASSQVNYGSEWTIHSAFENACRKIIPTKEGVTYFFVHQHLFRRNAEAFDNNKAYYYGSPSGALFFFDKNNPSAGIQDLAAKTRLSGFDMRLVNYCPKNGNLVIAYTDGGLDIVTPDRKVTYIDEIKNRTMAGASNISAISFDPANGDIWLGTGAGFVHIDASSLKISEQPMWEDAVADIVPVGDQVICAIGNTLYSAPKDANLNLRSSFKAAPISSSPGTVLALMPLSDNSFATANTAGTVCSLVFDGTRWSMTNLGNTLATANMGNNHLVSVLDSTVTPTENGYYIGDNKGGFAICRSDEQHEKPYVSKIALPGTATLYNASYDLNSFWFFEEPRNFVERTLADGKWTDVRSLEPKSPLSSYDNFMLYSPTQGLVMVNRHPQIITQYHDPYQNTLVAAYKNGEWRNLSPAFNAPYITDTNPEALSTWQKLVSQNKWIAGNPIGAVIDPKNPDVLFVGSIFEGMNAVYLDDPRKNPFIVNREKDTERNPFNAHHILEENTGWGGFTPVAPMGYDNDGNLWFYYNSIFTPDNRTNLVLYYITPEGRKKQLESGDGYNTANRLDIKKLVHPATIRASQWHMGTVLRHPKNKNKIILARKDGDEGGVCLHLFNHNGTIDDPSDDTLQSIYYLRSKGGLNEPISVVNLVENPVTGEVIVSLYRNTYVIDLNDKIENGVIPARPITIKGENGLSTDLRPALRSYFVTFDEYGRMWVPTQDYGLVCLSADGTEVVAQFDATNSPIGGDDIHSIGWNPDTKSLFVSANNVVAEVKIDNPESVGSQSSIVPMAYPQAVTPDFAGTVAFHNIPEGVMLRVRDSKGVTVAELDATANGVAYWNLLDRDGKSVPSDTYTIVDASTQSSFLPITLPVIR